MLLLGALLLLLLLLLPPLLLASLLLVWLPLSDKDESLDDDEDPDKDELEARRAFRTVPPPSADDEKLRSGSS